MAPSAKPGRSTGFLCTWLPLLVALAAAAWFPARKYFGGGHASPAALSKVSRGGRGEKKRRDVKRARWRAAEDGTS